MRPSSRKAAAACALALLLATSCGRDHPSQPSAGSVTGSVRLVGFLLDANGIFQGTRVVNDATGVPVELWDGTGPVSRTTTIAGQYTFNDVPHGTYSVHSDPGFGVTATSNGFATTGGPFTVPDTLELRSVGALSPVPNPWHVSTTVYYPLAQADTLTLEVVDLAGVRVRLLFHGPESATNTSSEIWDGRDGAGQTTPAGLYWFVLRESRATRAHLLFRE